MTAKGQHRSPGRRRGPPLARAWGFAPRDTARLHWLIRRIAPIPGRCLLRQTARSAGISALFPLCPTATGCA